MRHGDVEIVEVGAGEGHVARAGSSDGRVDEAAVAVLGVEDLDAERRCDEDAVLGVDGHAVRTGPGGLEGQAQRSKDGSASGERAVEFGAKGPQVRLFCVGDDDGAFAMGEDDAVGTQVLGDGFDGEPVGTDVPDASAFGVGKPDGVV